MPLVEVEDTLLHQLQQKAQAGDAAANFQKVWGEVLNGPDRLDALRLLKKKYPDTAIPELDTADAASKPILGKIEAIEKEFADYKAAVEKEKTEAEEKARKQGAERQIDGARRKLRGEGWDDEGIAKIEALMQERQIGDYEVAAAYVRAQEPPPSPLTQSYNGKDLNWFNPADDAPDHKLLMENPDQFKRQMIANFTRDKARGNLRNWAA